MASATETVFARAVVAHEREVKELKQQAELDLLIRDEGIKLAVVAAQQGDPAGRRVSVLKAICGPLIGKVQGCTRIVEASNISLGESVLRLKPKKPTPREGYQWK